MVNIIKRGKVPDDKPRFPPGSWQCVTCGTVLGLMVPQDFTEVRACHSFVDYVGATALLEARCPVCAEADDYPGLSTFYILTEPST